MKIESQMPVSPLLLKPLFCSIADTVAEWTSRQKEVGDVVLSERYNSLAREKKGEINVFASSTI
jgi:hypothetical protein